MRSYQWTNQPLQLSLQQQTCGLGLRIYTSLGLGSMPRWVKALCLAGLRRTLTLTHIIFRMRTLSYHLLAGTIVCNLRVSLHPIHLLVLCPWYWYLQPVQQMQMTSKNQNNRINNGLGSYQLRRIQTLCVALCIAPNSPVHSNAVINDAIAIRLF